MLDWLSSMGVKKTRSSGCTSSEVFGPIRLWSGRTSFARNLGPHNVSGFSLADIFRSESAELTRGFFSSIPSILFQTRSASRDSR
jgi:hypothetical protein